MSSVPLGCLIACLVVTALAAVIDTRRGHIPNWLTLPPLLLGPLAWGLYGGLWRTDRGSALGSVLSALLCGLVPWMLYAKRAIGGGDVKLFAAIGALVLVGVGIEAQFYAFCAGALFALARLAWHGKLWRTLSNTAFLALNPVLPARLRRTVAPELMTQMRFGAAIFAGTLAASAARLAVH